MIAQIKAELLKIRSTRTTIGLVLGMIALILLFALLSGLLTTPQASSRTREPTRLAGRRQPRRRLLGARGRAARHERVPLRHDPADVPLHPAALTGPRREARSRALLAGLVFGVVGEGLGFGIGYVLPPGRGIPFALDGGDRRAAAARNRRASVRSGARSASASARSFATRSARSSALLAWGFIVENLLFALRPIGRPLYPGGSAECARRTHDRPSALTRRRRRRADRLDRRALCRGTRPHSAPRRRLGRTLLGDRLEPRADLRHVGAEIVEPRQLRQRLRARRRARTAASSGSGSRRTRSRGRPRRSARARAARRRRRRR